MQIVRTELPFAGWAMGWMLRAHIRLSLLVVNRCSLLVQCLLNKEGTMWVGLKFWAAKKTLIQVLRQLQQRMRHQLVEQQASSRHRTGRA